MLECIFTIDYEIYGNGEGSLQDLVFEPAERLKALFDKLQAKFVVFVEAAELEKMDAFRTDACIDRVKNQVRDFYDDGFEIALHLHPQWCNARYQDGKWDLDYSEYNLCTLSPRRITDIVERSIAYLRTVLVAPDFKPYSFRAGNWLFQPTATAARVLMEHGIKIDSSVFKGGLQHKHKLDYRRAIRNGYYWKFRDDVTIPDPSGSLLEIPIHTTMVPFWHMMTPKRIGLQRKANSHVGSRARGFTRVLDRLRLWQPRKFDFCRMTLDELLNTVDLVIEEDRRSPELFKPMVAIGHTKDLSDFVTIDGFISYLRSKNIPISTFQDVGPKCQPGIS